jgi:hypothetical protein
MCGYAWLSMTMQDLCHDYIQVSAMTPPGLLASLFPFMVLPQDLHVGWFHLQISKSWCSSPFCKWAKCLNTAFSLLFIQIRSSFAYLFYIIPCQVTIKSWIVWGIRTREKTVHIQHGCPFSWIFVIWIFLIFSWLPWQEAGTSHSINTACFPASFDSPGCLSWDITTSYHMKRLEPLPLLPPITMCAYLASPSHLWWGRLQWFHSSSYNPYFSLYPGAFKNCKPDCAIYVRAFKHFPYLG